MSTDKGRMVRVKFRNRPRISQYRLECGAHDCPTVATLRDPAHARAEGWHRDTKGGYGWICPKCQEGGPLPEDQS